MEVLFFYFSITGEIIPGFQCMWQQLWVSDPALAMFRSVSDSTRVLALC